MSSATMRRRQAKRGFAKAAVALAGAGALLAAFPRMDHLWLDTAERAVPSLQAIFLTEAEKDAQRDAVDSVARAEAELAKLRKTQDDVRWGLQKMDDEKQERMRQYIAGRSEILAGDQLSLRDLRAVARERQRFALGLPLLILGIAVAAIGTRAGAGHFGMKRPVSGST